ncbi:MULTISPECIES: pyruvate kinase [Aerococcus]|uniref:Pyruvate kinase n=2 Tax=Aerococcus TaxID=1375 RepID=A0A5N1GIT3_9LACT|nr:MULTISPECIES: pyruvate kinase [Aerococcus]KAA9300853.1 pyruvate kinase [Aerococcus sanguinicola]MDK6369083.1 pyruvate kinase [Aerococcus sp. UMB9870]MDK6679858.1 pyruvate kinase [Aerococcus sp. UMB8608]MDK6686576.1 pyruvate kinase [Aerococcus sp. UMB8623]MDK6939780.1 pyruvate kinase [Aerococcus sp. UMB8487]
MKKQFLIDEVRQLRKQVQEEGQALYESWEPQTMREDFRASAQNLAAYAVMRQRDLRQLQESFDRVGYQGFRGIEANVLPGLDHLVHLLQDEPIANEEAYWTDLDQEQMHTYQVFGLQAGKRAQNLVTLPTEAGRDPHYVRDLSQSGMDLARINCAHDQAKTWQAMADHIRAAEQARGRAHPIYCDLAGPKVRIEALYTKQQNPRVYQGDRFFISHVKALEDFQGQDLVLYTSHQEIIQSLAIGDPLVMYDGDLLGHVVSQHDQGLVVEVDRVRKAKGQKIKASKGINFPGRDSQLPILTPADCQAMAQVKDFARGYNFSFVRQVEDIVAIKQQLAEVYGEAVSQHPPFFIKVETQSILENLFQVLVEANRSHHAGLMIARGDLAAELGFLRLASVQEDLVAIARAARIPVIWATQVLENMVKTGIPTRAEMADVMLAGRCDLVMLNKGDHIQEGIQLLNQVLDQSRQYMPVTPSPLRPLDLTP